MAARELPPRESAATWSPLVEVDWAFHMTLIVGATVIAYFFVRILRATPEPSVPGREGSDDRLTAHIEHARR